MAITTRIVKGSALTHAELDANFTDLVAADAALVIVDAATDTAVAALDTRLLVTEGNTIAVDKVYVSDGANSGAWKTQYNHGAELHVDVGTTAAPIALTLADTFYPLTNDSGTGTITTYKVPGSADTWNSATGLFDFDGAGLVLGDAVTLSVDLDIINVGANGTYLIALELGVGGTSHIIDLAHIDIKAAGTLEFDVEHTVEFFDANHLNFGARWIIKSDSTGDTIVVNEFALEHLYRNPRYIT